MRDRTDDRHLFEIAQLPVTSVEVIGTPMRFLLPKLSRSLITALPVGMISFGQDPDVGTLGNRLKLRGGAIPNTLQRTSMDVAEDLPCGKRTTLTLGGFRDDGTDDDLSRLTALVSPALAAISLGHYVLLQACAG
jgi:hypothetical protein